MDLVEVAAALGLLQCFKVLLELCPERKLKENPILHVSVQSVCSESLPEVKAPNLA